MLEEATIVENEGDEQRIEEEYEGMLDETTTGAWVVIEETIALQGWEGR